MNFPIKNELRAYGKMSMLTASRPLNAYYTDQTFFYLNNISCASLNRKYSIKILH